MIYNRAGIFSEMAQAKHFLFRCNYDLYDCKTWDITYDE